MVMVHSDVRVDDSDIDNKSCVLQLVLGFFRKISYDGIISKYCKYIEGERKYFEKYYLL